MKIRNRKFRLPESEVREMLKTAALEKKGFKVQVTTKMVKDLVSGEQHCQVSVVHILYSCTLSSLGVFVSLKLTTYLSKGAFVLWRTRHVSKVTFSLW